MSTAWWARAGCLVAVAFSLAALPSAEAATLRLDRRFGEDGIARLRLRLGPEWGFGRALRPVRQPDGKLLAAGVFSRFRDLRVVVARFKRTDQLDRAFGRGGQLRLPWNFSVRFVRVQPDGESYWWARPASSRDIRTPTRTRLG